VVVREFLRSEFAIESEIQNDWMTWSLNYFVVQTDFTRRIARQFQHVSQREVLKSEKVTEFRTLKT
jgi:hypothetical protein